ncbi:hypothetical protein LRR81_07715 [Metabacillus sp. GX 13764]|uniref:hypothetical protein n=1 Tax=Metabacillus kandeliae TaxID=2900151 RepID=UPI001E53FAE5|nr:hypothetical protein [Metabacillus kandeliae]MCD7034117.1 hypothetical protein [Metabacillus kandeliae]
MSGKLLFLFLTAVFFVIYFQISSYLVNAFLPITPAANLFSLVLLIILLLAAVFSAEKAVKTIRK